MAFSSRRCRPLPPNWAATVLRILTRDNRTCYICGGAATEVDHVLPASQGGGDGDVNLAAICVPCHRQKTAQEANEARRVKYSRRRPSEPHPGLIEPSRCVEGGG
jgi:5-methylcytosine-specific restriction endonuclease McrA